MSRYTVDTDVLAQLHRQLLDAWLRLSELQVSPGEISDPTTGDRRLTDALTAYVGKAASDHQAVRDLLESVVRLVRDAGAAYSGTDATVAGSTSPAPSTKDTA